MEKAILKTLIYANIFDYPLTIFEIHKWLIGPPAGRAGRKVTLRQVESAIGRLSKKAKVKSKKDYYFLPKQDGLVGKRKHRERQSEGYLRKAQILTFLLKMIPWIKLVGISGGLAMNNASKKDDIDLFIITEKNRLWISRLIILSILSLVGQRRKVGDVGRKIAGKLCINTLLEEDRLAQSSKDIYLAHEVLQMRVLWQRDGVYGKYLEENSWAFKFLPNWVGNDNVQSKMYNVKKRSNNSKLYIVNYTFGLLENLAKKFQLWYMKSPRGMERIEDGALYFHPNDIRPKILKLYKQKISKL